MDSFAILDIRGLVLRSLHSGTDRDAVVDSLTGGRINTPGYAVEGFLRDYLIPILKDFRAKQVIAVWDGGNLYRRTLFPAYKQHRRDKEQSPELKQAMEGAIKAVKVLLLYLGAIQTTVDDVEADDVIAWLVEKLPSTIVYTVDRDLIQLAGDRCSVYVGREFTDVLQEGEVTVPAHRVTLFKSIVGDSSDGYLGVRGFGPKKWLKLVEEEGEHGLEVLQSWVSAGMFSELHRLVKENPGANELVELLAANTQDWRKGWMLASLQPDLVNRRVRKPVLDKETLEVISTGANGYQTPRWSTALPRADKLSLLLDSLGCTHLAHELAEFMPNMPAVLDASIVVDQEAALDELQAAFAESPFIALDWETSAPINPNFEKAANGREYVDMLSSTITGAGLTFGKRLEHTLYLPVNHADTANLPAEFVHELIKRVPPDVPLAIQNCLLGDVEVLTPNGWKTIESATTADQIMQWDPETGNLSFVHPTAKVEQIADSMWEWEASFHACAYTDAHRMYLSAHKSKWKVYTADRAAYLHPNSFYVPVAGRYAPDAPISISDDEARLMEAIRADGHFPTISKRLKFRFSKERKIARIRDILNRLDLQFTSTVYYTGPKPVTQISLELSPIIARLKNLLGPDKEYGLWVMNLPLSAREAILDELRFWDGDRHFNSHSNRVFTVSKNTVAALQIMAHTSDRRFSVSWSEHNKKRSEVAQLLASVCIAPKNKTKLSNVPKRVEGSFSVYCFSVPTGAFMVRSKGRVHVTGNCYFEEIIYKNQFGEDLPECHDTKIMASHVDEQESSGLKDLSLRLLGYKQLKYRDVIEKGKAMKDYSAAHVLQYGADDPLVTAHLYEFLKLQLLLEGTWEFVRDNEFTAVRHLVEAYLNGVEIDWDELERLRLEDEEIFDRSMTRLRQLLKEHQTPASIEAGVENLLEVERELLDARYKKKVEDRTMTEAEAQAAKANDLALAYLNLRDRVEYSDPARVEKPVKFGLTPAAFSTAAEQLGLPRLEASTKTGWTRWLEEAKQCQTTGLAARIVELVEEGFDDVVAKNVNSPIVANIISKTRPIYLETLPEKRKYEMTGSELSLNSPRQMQALLYGTLGLPIRVRNFEPKGEREDLELEGGPQANEDAILTAMAMDAPAGTWKREALDCLLAAKKASTRCKNFYAAYPLWRHPLTGRVHPQLNSCGTETRRMSGSSPNLMQLPKKNEGIKVRKIIRPPQGHDLVCSIDWAGEELRVAAGLSLDTEMLSCYIDAEGVRKLPQWALKMLGTENINRFMSSTLRDIHSLTAAGIADVPYDEFEAVRHDKKHVNYSKFTRIRGEAKSVNFLSQYGGGPTKLARKLICPVEQAQDYLSSKKKLYYKYEDWREVSIQKLHADGYLATLYGTRRHLFNRLMTGDEGLRGYMERAALNFLIQGLCADYLKKVLAELWKRQTFQRHGAKFLAPIHDEIVFTCHSSQAPDLILEVHSIMTQGIEGLPCPLWAEPSVGPSFGVQKEIGPHPTKELIVAAINEALDTQAEVA